MSILGKNVNKLLGQLKNAANKAEWDEAFKNLYDATYNHLRLIAYNYLTDISYVEDVLNDAYFKVSRYVDSADLKKDGYNWICKSVQNKAYDYNRLMQVYEPIDKVENEENFNDISESELEKDNLLRALKKLSPQDYKLVYLRYWRDLTISEVAKRMHLKKSTAYKRLQVLCKKLEKDLDEGKQS